MEYVFKLMVILFLKVYNMLQKEWFIISLKKRLSFDELVQENRKQIWQDESFLEKFEQNMENKMHQSLNKKRGK